MKLFKPQWLQAWRSQIRQDGVKAFIVKKGWKVFAAFILFYFVRDVTLYIIIPYFVFRNL
ncbi:MAG: hypothetical protein E4H13_02940 [Calditrichales bacterium]|nr:MAG: hypothetical protein E4H13_02940 [Calditrichales bacterium]